MNFEELENSGMIKKVGFKEEAVKELIELAERDLKLARKMLKQDLDWAFNIAYNSILQSSRALMFFHGFRPVGRDQHLTVEKFVSIALGEEFKEKVNAFDRIRRKRHTATYDRAGIISNYEANYCILMAQEFMEEIKKAIKKKNKR